MELNQTTLRGILASILSVNQKYIVPKQGNWWNPQEANANIETWCAYRIKSNRPITTPYYYPTENAERVCVQKIADIELQFVGRQSEELAQSVAMWAYRSDVQAQLKTVQGAIINGDMTAVSSFFAQDGNNSIMAWNVNFSVLWVSEAIANQNQILTINIGGQVNVRQI